MIQIPTWRAILILGSTILAVSIIAMMYAIANLAGALGAVGRGLDAEAAQMCSANEQVVKLPSAEGPSNTGSLGFDYFCEDAEGEQRDITRQVVRSFSDRILPYPKIMVVATITIVAGVLIVLLAVSKRRRNA